MGYHRLFIPFAAGHLGMINRSHLTCVLELAPQFPEASQQIKLLLPSFSDLIDDPPSRMDIMSMDMRV
jgi:hypothetical protein